MSPATRERLSVDDAQILRLESPVIKGHTGKVLIAAPDSAGEPLSVPRLRERVAERMEAFPRLGQRVVEPRLGLGRPAWVEADQIDLDWHVSTPAHADPLSDEELRAAIGELLSERLDHTRPLWRLDVLPLTGGRAAIVGRIHHAMADGVSAIKLTAGLLWDRDVMTPNPHAPAPAPGAARAKGSPAGPAAGAAEERILVRLPSALWRELRPGRDTTFDHHIGPAREVAWSSFPLERLKRIGHSAPEGATVNDVVLAVVAGALRRWLPEAGGVAQDLRVQCPVYLHAREEEKAELGNRDSFMNVDLPIAEPDPQERLRLINVETSQRKFDHDADALYAFFHALSRFRPLYKGVTRLTAGPREFALSVSNVPGPRERAVILGHAVEQFCSFAEPADRHALRISVVSLEGELAFGLCSDPEAISKLDGLRGALADSISELEGSGLMPRSLKEYERKRDFSKTKEPSGRGKKKGKARRKHPRFAFQKHSATSEHYDLRLEVDGVLASWAIPKGPSLDPRDKRLAMRTEDHPLDYLEWEGVIEEGSYGAGPMIVWDRGVFQNISETRKGQPMDLQKAIEVGDVKVFMLGEKIKGAYALVRTGPPSDREKWLFIKKRDEGADARRKPTSSQPESVLSGRTIEQVLEEEAEPGQFQKHRARRRSRRR